MGIISCSARGAINYLAVGCAVILVLSWFAAGRLICDLHELQDEVLLEVREVKVITDETWYGMMAIKMATKRAQMPTAESLFKRKKRDAYLYEQPQQCNCGYQSLNCPQGPPGPSGEAGYDGEQGYPGLDGKPGISGSEYSDYYQGREGGCIICPVGPPGQPGLDGNTGPPGMPGQPGLAGSELQYERQGPPGPPGDTGVPGRQGEMGRPGIPGDDVIISKQLPGLKGPPGSPGNPGQPGIPGPTAAPGRMGLRGPMGVPGTPGRPGMTGPPGRAGNPGLPGVDAQYCRCPLRSPSMYNVQVAPLVERARFYRPEYAPVQRPPIPSQVYAAREINYSQGRPPAYFGVPQQWRRNY